MKFLGFATVCAASLACATAADSLKDFRWKKRLLVVTESSPALNTQLVGAKEGLAERDVEVFILRGVQGAWRTPPPALSKELEQRLKLDAQRAEIGLLGKDGMTTVRWTVEEFTTDALFAAIDAMPMRQKEMK